MGAGAVKPRFSFFAKLDDSVCYRIECIIIALAYSFAGEDAASALTHNNVARTRMLAVSEFYAKIFRL